VAGTVRGCVKRRVDGNPRGQRRVRGPSTANAYAVLSFALGQTERITGMVTVTNVPCRPAAVLARTVTSL